jgi:hypothetical protein
MRSHSHTRPTTLRTALVALSVLTLIGGACGSADDDAQGDGVASLRDTSEDGAATVDGSVPATADSSRDDSSELEAPEDPEEAFALYDQCLQDHGVDPGDGFVVSGGGDAIAVAPADRASSDGAGPDNQVFVFGEGPNGEQPPEVDQKLIEASEACRGHLANATPDFDLTPEQQAAMEDAQLAFQQCMEEHGIEGGGFSIAIGDGQALDVNEHQDDQAAPPPVSVAPEQFQAAAEECQSVYDDYPELDDVLPDGGPMGGVSVGSATTATGSSGAGS